MHRMQRLRPRQNDRDRSSDRPHAHLYHGHRRNSFTTADIEELTELRARQRTFEGAYQRTALGMAVYAIIVLKIFSPAFAKSECPLITSLRDEWADMVWQWPAVGIIYVVMAALLLIISIVRRRRSDHDMADSHRPPVTAATSPAASKRVWGREFR